VFKLILGFRKKRDYRVVSEKEKASKIDLKGKGKEVVVDLEKSPMGLGSPFTLSKRLEIEEGEEELQSLIKDVSTLVVPDIITERDLTSAQATHLLCSFLRLSKRDRNSLLALDQKKLAVHLAEAVGKKRKGVKFTKSPKHKRSRPEVPSSDNYESSSSDL
jgi:hypothetical protein